MNGARRRRGAPWPLLLLAGLLACGPVRCGNPVEEADLGRVALEEPPAEASGRLRAAGGREARRAAAGDPLQREPGAPRGAYPAVRGRVVKVVDGDTVHVRIDARGREKVRYIGIDTPETKHPRKGVEPFGPEASALNRELVGGRRVVLRFDRELRDRYGRLLAYVYREEDGLFVNAELVRRGLARALRVRPNTRHAELLERLEREARAARRGMWAVAPGRAGE